MSEERYTTKDLELPDDEPMVIIRSSMLWMCDGDKYAAAALNMYVHWTRWLMKHKPVAQEINRMLKKQGKAVSQDTSLIIYRKQSDLIADLLDFCNEKRFRQSNTLLAAKGLLKIDNTPRSISDHILKYELQIGKFKALMAEWRKQRQESGLNEDDEECEVSLEADSDGTDNSPSRNGQFTVSERTKDGSRNGQKSVIETDNSPSRNGQFTAPNKNIDNRVIDNLIDDTREDDGVGSIERNTPSLSLQEMIALLSENGYHVIVPDTGTIQGHHQGSEHSPEIVHAPSFSTDPDVKGDVSPTQDSGFLPSGESENASAHTNTSIGVSQSSQGPLASPQRENEAPSTNGPSKQASYSRENAHETLPARQKPEQPVMPPVEMKWSAEKLVQITEARRFVRGKQGVYFDEEPRGSGAKSQRQRQLEAAKSIIARKITEAQYLAAYDEVNNEWWNKKGSVTVELLAANTPRRNMRIVEVTEELESRSETVPTKGKGTSRPGSSQTLVRPNKTAYTEEEMRMLRRMTPDQRKEWTAQRRLDRQAQAVGQ